MKKTGLYIMALAAVAFTSCDEGDYADWAPAQGQEQEEVLEAAQLAIEPAAAIDMATVQGDSVQVFAITPSLPAGFELAGYTTVLNDSYELPVSLEGMAAVADVKTAVENFYGKAPVERELTVKVTADIKSGDKTYRKVADPVAMKVTLVAPYISEHYWIVGAPSQWDVMCVDLPFSHSDVNVYDDPVFTVTFPLAAGDTWFAVADEKTHESGEWSALLGCAEGNGLNGMEGFIARRTDLSDDGSWMLHADADCHVRMTINMMDYSYKFEYILFSPYVYLPGDANGWSFDKDILLGNNEGQYEGYAVLGGTWGWKVTTTAGWDDEYGSGGDGVIAKGGGNIMEGTEAKQYYVTVDMTAMTYSLMEVNSFSIIGSVKGSWDTDVDMTADLANHCWTVTADLDAGEFKFRVNHDWGKNLGGTYDSMVANGDNLQLPEAGNYTITLYPSYDGASHCTVVKN